MAINRVRLSFISQETSLSAAKFQDAPLNSITSQFGYMSSVHEIQNGATIDLGLQLPWPKPSGQRFWERYLHSLTPEKVTGKLCFRRLVPLRFPDPVSKPHVELKLDDQTVNARVTVEGYFYPFGTGVIATVSLNGSFSLDETGNLCQSVRNSKVYLDEEKNGAPGAAISLGNLISDSQDKLRELGFGPNATGGVRGVPFSVVTVLSGSDFDHSTGIDPDGEVHRFLNGIVEWVPNWQKTVAPPFQEGINRLRTQSSTTSPGDALAASKRGRAVWFPLRFGQNNPGIHSLACYHRNLTFASLQTESLLMLADEVEKSFSQSAFVPASTQRIGKIAAGLLGRLFSGTETYRSYSICAQIQQSNSHTQVDKLRNRFGMSNLTQGET